MLKPKFPLALALDKDSSSIQFRDLALLDSGFDGFLIINQHIASIIRPRLTRNVVVNIGSNKNILAPAFNIFVAFETMDKDYFLAVEGLLLPSEPSPVIGSKLIDQLCNQEKWHLLFNYMDKQVEFVQAK